MQLWFWIWLVVVLKIPVVFIFWYIYKVVQDQPDEVITDGEGGSGVRFEQGPRKRGPRDPRQPWSRTPRRGDSGHDETQEKRASEPVSKHGLRGE